MEGPKEDVLIGMDVLNQLGVRLVFNLEMGKMPEEDISTCAGITARANLESSHRKMLQELLNHELLIFAFFSVKCCWASNNDNPIKQRYYPRNPKQQEIIDFQINDLLEEGPEEMESNAFAYLDDIIIVSETFQETFKRGF